MKKIYIDCGVWNGKTILEFKRWFKNYDIYAFECEPRLKNQLEQLSVKHKFNLIYKAVWTKNTEINLYPGRGNLTQSSSLSPNKKEKLIDRENPVSVSAIDFSAWILNNFTKDDYIICKMNIEGAEYDVLEKMVKDGSIHYIDRLYVAWHNKKLNNIPTERHNNIRSTVNSITELLNWR